MHGLGGEAGALCAGDNRGNGYPKTSGHSMEGSPHITERWREWP